MSTIKLVVAITQKSAVTTSGSQIWEPTVRETSGGFTLLIGKRRKARKVLAECATVVTDRPLLTVEERFGSQSEALLKSGRSILSVWTKIWEPI